MFARVATTVRGAATRCLTRVQPAVHRVRASMRSHPLKWRAAGVGAALTTAVGLTTSVVYASDDALPPPEQTWSHHGVASAFDAASLRRGFEVYRNVCSTCHSLENIAYRHLIGHSHTEEQARALAESIEVQDGPNDEGEMFARPGKISDYLPKPYPNEATARLANNGALPPDLSLIAIARHGYEDYVYSLITGYREPPAGMQLRSGLYYNPYFPGGAIAMAPPLNDGQVEYEDGTPATVTQMAKDVATFLVWASEPATDQRKKDGLAMATFFTCAFVLSTFWKRFRWNVYKTRRIYYK